MLRSLLRRFFKLLLAAAVTSVVLVVVMRWVPPLGSALMLERKVESWLDGKPIDLQRQWRPWEQLPDDLKIAVIAAGGWPDVSGRLALPGPGRLAPAGTHRLSWTSGGLWPWSSPVIGLECGPLRVAHGLSCTFS